MQLTDVPLISRSTLFGNPERGVCKISPCGGWLAFVAPHHAVMNVWVCEIGPDPVASIRDARPVTDDRGRGIHDFIWAHDGVHLLYHQDQNGDENAHLYAVPFRGGPLRDLTPFAGAKASLQDANRRQPSCVLVSINHRDPRFSDLYRIELASGESTLAQQNPGYFGFVTDDEYRVRLAIEPKPDGSRVLLKWDAGTWTPWRHISVADSANTWPQGISADGRTLYMLDSAGRDTAALVSFDLDRDADNPKIIAQHASADVVGMWTDVQTHEPLAWFAVAERREIHVLSDRLAPDVAHLDGQGLGEWSVASRSDDDKRWIVLATTDVAPVAFYLYERAGKMLTKLYDARPALSKVPLARMQHTTLTSRDGLSMVTYLTLPVHADKREETARSTEPLALVLLVHGGPQLRDYWGYNPMHQWLANRGYAVMSVNYRASTGFGKAFVAAGDGQWGAKMDDDLVDAVEWAIARGIADPSRICIMGGSYGGYAALWSMTANPDLYACGVDIVGPSNLATLAASIPPYWEAAKTQFFRMIGDPATEEGRALLEGRSPVHRAARIRKPLLIAHGANDPRVKQAESDQMAAAMKKNGIPVSYVLFSDEGHGFTRPANSIRFNAITEQFLSRFIGGRFEPLVPAEVEGNSAVFVEDAL